MLKLVATVQVCNGTSTNISNELLPIVMTKVSVSFFEARYTLASHRIEVFLLQIGILNVTLS